MKALFTNPPWWIRQEGTPPKRYWIAGVRAGSRWPMTGAVASSPDRFRFGDYLPYPCFMGYAASYAQRHTDAQIFFRDSIALRESYDTYYRHIEHGGYDFIFFESSSPSWGNDTNIIREIHRRSPNARIVVTGPVMAAKAENALAELPIHACIKGEYEKGSVRVINGESGVLDFDLLTTEEMNSAPFPYYDDTHAKRYWDGSPAGQQRPQAQVWASRGCPFKCIFCVWPATMTSNDPDGAHPRKVRHYTPEYVEALVRELIERYHYRCIYFDDDTFNLGDSHVRGICEVMAHVGVPWSAMCRADTIRMETWAIMKESGCFGVKIGFESGNQWVVDNIVKKRLDLELAKEVVYELKRLGMTVHGTFTLGLPGETPEQMEDTKRLANELPFDTCQASGTAVIEGTPLHTLEKHGHLDAYAGARIDAGYESESDGNVRFQHIAASFGQGGQAKADEQRARIDAVCKGYSTQLHWLFYEHLFAKCAPKNICVLGVYFGRDIAYMAAILENMGAKDYRIVGVDKFEDSPGADWPEGTENLTWEDAGYGEPPAIEKALAALNELGLAANVELHKQLADEFLTQTDRLFDLIYIDVSHDYDTTVSAIKHAAKHIRPGGIIAGDDFTNQGTCGVADAVRESFTAFNVAGDWLWYAPVENCRFAQ